MPSTTHSSPGYRKRQSVSVHHFRKDNRCQFIISGTFRGRSSFLDGFAGQARLTSRLGVDRSTCLDNAQPLPTSSRALGYSLCFFLPAAFLATAPVGVRRRDSRPGVLDVFGGQHQPLADRCGVAPERVRGSGSGCGRSPGGTGPAGRCRSGRTPPPASTPSLSLQAAVPHRSASVRPAAFVMPCCVPVGRVRLP